MIVFCPTNNATIFQNVVRIVAEDPNTEARGSSPTLSHVSKVKMIRNEFVQEIRVLAHFLDALDIGHNHGNDRVIIQLLDDSKSEKREKIMGHQ